MTNDLESSECRFRSLSTGVLLSRGSPRSSGRGWHERDRSVSLAACGTASIDRIQKEQTIIVECLFEC